MYFPVSHAKEHMIWRPFLGVKIVTLFAVVGVCARKGLFAHKKRTSMPETPPSDYAELIGQLLEANRAMPARVLDWLIGDPRSRPGQSGLPGF